MKTMFWRLFTVALAAFALSFTAYAGEDEKEGHEGESGLEEAMKEMGGAFKKLSRSMRNPDASDIATYQAQAATIKKNAVKAKALVPERAEEAGEEKQAMVAAYRKGMEKLIHKVELLQEALKAGDLEKAQTLVDELNKARKQGHKSFMKPDED